MGHFTHHVQGQPIVLELMYCDTTVQVVNTNLAANLSLDVSIVKPFFRLPSTP